MPPTTTTTVAGRKRRDLNSILPNVNPDIQAKVLQVLTNFYKSSDKVQLLKKLLDK